MSHFSKDLLEAAPETLAALRDLLHGSGAENRRGGRAPSVPPGKEGRTVGGKAGRAAPVRRRGSPASIRA